MTIIVTGAAGFIGSCVVRTLNDVGIGDVIAVDNVAKTDKWMNLRNKKYLEYIHKSAFLEKLPKIAGGGYPLLSTWVHARPLQSGTLTTFGTTILSLQRRCGTTARKKACHSSTQALRPRMGTGAGDLTTGETLTSSCR